MGELPRRKPEVRLGSRRSPRHSGLLYRSEEDLAKVAAEIEDAGMDPVSLAEMSPEPGPELLAPTLDVDGPAR